MDTKTTSPKPLESRLDVASKINRSSILDLALDYSLNTIYPALGQGINVAIFDKKNRKVYTPSMHLGPEKSRPKYLKGINEAVKVWSSNPEGEESPSLTIPGTSLSLVLDRNFSDLTDSQREFVYDFVTNNLGPALDAYFEPERETQRLRKQVIYDTQFYKQGIPVHTKAFAEDVLGGKLRRANGARDASVSSDDLSVLVIDIDKFKSVNDRYGHQSGDIVIYAVAQTIVDNVRADDIVARNGAGDEYLVILSRCDPENASKRAESIRKAVGSLEIKLEPSPGKSVNYSPTISVGGYSVSQLEGGLTVENLIANADRALYDAKEGGRNRVVFGGISVDCAEDTNPSLLEKTSVIFKSLGNKVRDLFTKYVEPREPFAYLSRDYNDDWTQAVQKSNNIPFEYLSKNNAGEWGEFVREDSRKGAKVVSVHNNPRVPFAYLSSNYGLGKDYSQN